MTKAEIITIGDEILIGQITDTNSVFLAQRLNEIGISIVQITSISDTKEAILEALANAEKRVDLVLMTGGLGPTKDDITKKTLCDYFDSELVHHSEVEKHIRKLFINFKSKILDVNLLQADLPKKSEVLFNPFGTAMGMWFEQNKTIFVSMPGVPYEMKKITTDVLLPKLEKHFQLQAIYHKTILTAGVGESILADKIKSVADNLPEDIKLAYLPSLGKVRMRLSGFGKNYEALKKAVDAEVSKILPLVEEYHFGFDTETLQEAIGKLLVEKNAKLALGESCTGGYISHLFTSKSGSSAYFEGSAVSYSYELKESMLGVSKKTLLEFGAVSEACVLEMVAGIRKKLNADYGIAVSGIAGPTGGTPDKPVGTVWIAIATPKETFAKQFEFSKNRIINIQRTAAAALTLLWKALKE